MYFENIFYEYFSYYLVFALKISLIHHFTEIFYKKCFQNFTYLDTEYINLFKNQTMYQALLF